MSIELRGRRYSFYIGISTLVVAIVVVLTGLFLWISHRESTTAALQMADRLFTEVNQKVTERYEHALESVAVLAGSAARMPEMDRVPEDDGLSHPGMELMLRTLERLEYLSSVYCGYADGSFLQATAVRDDPAVAALYDAPATAVTIVRTITVDSGGVRRQHWRFLNAERRIVGGRDEANPEFDPRARPWYRLAMGAGSAVYTDPYVFYASKAPGITCAEKFVYGGGVVGADITLARFAVSLQRQKLSENALLFLFDRKGRLIAHPSENPVTAVSVESGGKRVDSLQFIAGERSQDPRVRAIVAAHEHGAGFPVNVTREMEIDGQPFLVRLDGLKADLKFDQILGSAAPMADFTGHIRRMQQRTTLLSLLVTVAALPLVLLVSRRISRSLTRLEKEASKVQRFDFSESEPFDSRIQEIHSLIRAFIIMKATIRERTNALIATQKKLEQLVKSGIALTAEGDMDRLLELIFDAARQLSNADGGTLYLRDEADNLRFEILSNAEGAIRRADARGETAGFAPVPINKGNAPGARRRVESHVALTGETVVIDDAAAETRFDLADACCLDGATGTACSAFLTAPLKTREGRTIGVLQIFNARDAETGRITGFNQEIVGFVEALAAQAAVALHNKRLLEEQRALFDAFIQLMAGAIDAKSPYTGGHCARVPEVAVMLAKAASDAAEGPFASFRLKTDDQWREFKVAAWLHDCGKVTTPEYVVDKATKLETIYNRIHEIRMRFEVLWRDAEIDHYRQLLAGTGDESGLKARLDAARERIREDFAFVAACNVGGEYMAEDKIARLRQIASQTWIRHLDDRLGISQEEARLKNRRPAPALPAVEPLLADKPEHIVPRTEPDPFAENPFGFNMVAPTDLYNLGELYNLGIRRGTLSPEDRFKINEHIIQTIQMLERLPFPDYLQNVAEIAGAHHETMIGTGYPRGLTKDRMSVPARIMAIADIFEALTAADRPYKKPKKLSESLRIMRAMRDDQHIDPDLFDLFLESGVYKAYAEKFLDPGQIDAVDIREYLSKEGT